MLALYTGYVIFLFVAVGLAAGLAIVAWYRRRVAGALTFMIFNLVALLWSGTSALAAVGGSEAAALLWGQHIRYVAIALVGPALLAFVLEVTGRAAGLRLWRLLPLLSIPVVTIGVVFLGPGDFFLYDFHYREGIPYYILESNAVGPWFWVHSVYSYLLVGTGIALLAIRTFRAPVPYNRQAAWLLVGALVPIMGNVMALVGDPLPLLDWTSLAFAATGLIWAWALFQSRLLDLMPVARDVVLESMEDAVLVLDLQGRVLDFNPAARRLIEDASPIAGKTIAEMFPSYIESIRQFETVFHANTTIEVGEGPDRETYDLQISPLLYRRQPSGRLVVLRDVTERQRLIEELDAYAHTVAHDLKNPLSTIYSYAYYLRDEYREELPEAVRFAIQTITEQSDKAARIVDELLVLASVRRLDEVDLVPLDMGEVVKQALRQLEMQIEQDAVQIESPDSWPVGLGYPPWVEEVWANYISNAIKYGGKPPLVVLGADEPANGQVRFWVRDNGEGLTSEEQEGIFGEFVRLGRDPHQEGIGLGLSIVQRIVRRLGGEVGLESALGQGTLFYFTLPRADKTG